MNYSLKWESGSRKTGMDVRGGGEKDSEGPDNNGRELRVQHGSPEEQDNAMAKR